MFLCGENKMLLCITCAHYFLINIKLDVKNHKGIIHTLFKICLVQAVKPLAYMGITVKNDVHLTAKTMYVTYRTERVLGVCRDGLAQFVT